MIPTWRPGALARAAGTIAAGNALRTALQGVVFIALGRLLGIEAFGALSAVLAVAGSVGQLSSLGTQMVLLREASRAPETFPRAWAATRWVTHRAAIALMVAFLPLALWLAPDGVSLADVLLLGFAEIVAAPVSMIAISAYQAHDRMAHSSIHLVMPALTRALAVVVFAALHRMGWGTLTLWCVLYAAAATASALYALRQVRAHTRAAGGTPGVGTISRYVREGWPFAAGAISLRVYADIDKAMLGRMDTLAATGGYAAAYRFSDLLLAPAVSLLTAAQPRLFRAGARGAGELMAYVTRLAVPSLALGAASSIALWLAAPFVPALLGSSFSGAIDPLRWIAFLPFVSLPRLFAQHALVGSDRAGWAIGLLAAGGGLNIALNLVSIPLLGWKGAVLSTYASEAAMSVGMLLCVRHTLLNRDAHGGAT